MLLATDIRQILNTQTVSYCRIAEDILYYSLYYWERNNNLIPVPDFSNRHSELNQNAGELLNEARTSVLLQVLYNNSRGVNMTQASARRPYVKKRSIAQEN